MAGKLSDISRLIKKALTSKEVLEVGAKVAVESIPLRTRLGKGVNEPEGSTHLLPALKEKTKRNRRYLKSSGKLTGPGATPAKSGLNASGDLLTDMKYEIKSDSFDIKLADVKQEEKLKNLLKINKNFQFLNLSRAEVNRMIKAMSVEINKVLANIKFDRF